HARHAWRGTPAASACGSGQGRFRTRSRLPEFRPQHSADVKRIESTGSSPMPNGIHRTQPETLWRHMEFMRLWAGQSISQVGSAVTTLALPLTGIAVLKASAFQVGLLTAATYTAFIFISLPAGVIVDRCAKRKIMIWCDAARLIIVGSIPVAALLGVLTMAQLFAVALVAGVFTVFFDVSYQSYVPVLLGRDRLADGNRKLGASPSFAQVTGP